MDGGRSFGIEESLQNGRRKGNIRGSMKKKEVVLPGSRLFCGCSS
jgi:hypothetical protein